MARIARLNLSDLPSQQDVQRTLRLELLATPPGGLARFRGGIDKSSRSLRHTQDRVPIVYTWKGLH
jgi:hypothetical protein